MKAAFPFAWVNDVNRVFIFDKLTDINGKPTISF